MSRPTFTRLATALVIAALVSMGFGSVASAQTGPLVRVDTPASSSTISGIATFTGVAVDCATGQPALRVSAYEGTSTTGEYLGDAQLGSSVNLSGVCAGMTTSAAAGFTIVVDTRRLSEGHDAVTFVATFASGAIASRSADVFVNNYSNFGYSQFYPGYSSFYPGYSSFYPGYYQNLYRGYYQSPYAMGYYGQSSYYDYGPGYDYGYGCNFYSYSYRADSPRVGCPPFGVNRIITDRYNTGYYPGYFSGYGYMGYGYTACSLCINPSGYGIR